LAGSEKVLENVLTVLESPGIFISKSVGTLKMRSFELESTKSIFGCGFTPDPAGGAHDAMRDPIISWGGVRGNPIPIPFDAFGTTNCVPNLPDIEAIACVRLKHINLTTVCSG